MNDREIRGLVEDVREGKLPRRSFIQTMVGAGLTAPMASMLLMHYGVANAQTMPAYKPTKRGGGGTLKLIYWQAAVHLNPHYAGGTKDQDASRILQEIEARQIALQDFSEVRIAGNQRRAIDGPALLEPREVLVEIGRAHV